MNLLHYIFRIELHFYFSIWILTVIYALYSFTNRSYLYFQHHKDNYEDLINSNYFSNRRDKADFEWEGIYYLLIRFFPWVFIYVGISEFIRKLPLTFKVVQIWQICFTILYILSEMGYVMVSIILLQPAIFYLICNFYRKSIITWLCTGISLLFITHCKQFSANDDYQEYFVTLCLFWMNLKCTSYFLERYSSRNILDFMSYCLYLPTIFTGPFIPHKDYLNICKPTVLPLKKRLQKLVLNLGRCLLWYLFTNICLHYMYVNATSYQPKLIKSFNNWSLYGYGYAMGQFFHIKYVVLYGLSTSFASFENVTVPHLPRCIGRIHLYSDMWKYFDPGLYTFLLRYIYIPVCQICHYKLIASMACFIFIYLWHGLEMYILIWTTLNYIGILLEYTSSLVYKKYFEKNCAEKIGIHWLKRIKCIIASPLLALSAISNFYFFASTEVGNIYMSRIFQDNCVSNAALFFVLYCCCQVSTELQDVNAHRM